MLKGSILKFTGPIESRTKLHKAVMSGKPAIVTKLLRRTPSLLDQKDSQGYTALMYAFATEETQGFPICQYLIDQGADLYVSNAAWGGLLLIAAARNEPGLIRLLITKEHALNSNRLISTHGKKAIKIALEGRRFWVIQPLLEAGADPDALLKLDHFDFYVLATKISNQNTPEAFMLCEYLLKRFGEILKIDIGITILQYAACLLSLNMVKFFLKEGKCPNERNANDWTALYYAVSIAGSKPDALKKLEAIIESLLDAKADPNLVITEVDNKKDSDTKVEDTALNQAIYYNLESIVEKLLHYKANPNLVDHRGSTTLMKAVLYGRSIKIVKNLVEFGGDISLSEPEDGINLLHLAVMTGNEEIKEILNADQGLGGNRIKIVKYLLDSEKLSVNSVDKRGKTPLQFAFLIFQEGTTAQRILQMLKVYGADLDQPDNEGCTPRDAATEKALEYFNAPPSKQARAKKAQNTSFFDEKQTLQSSNHGYKGCLYRSKQ